MIVLHKTDASDARFQGLVGQLDAELAVIDGEEHAFYHQYNHIDDIKYAIVAMEAGHAIACGAIKHFDTNTVEVKRMYTLADSRGKGLATNVLKALEDWAAALGYQRCVLETGRRQQDAIALYQKNGYTSIPNYGQYIGVENSVCFEKLV
ncbi:MAG: GNAT family N-acetyltransferase [Bacteroidota bacterium]